MKRQREEKYDDDDEYKYKIHRLHRSKLLIQLHEKNIEEEWNQVTDHLTIVFQIKEFYNVRFRYNVHQLRKDAQLNRLKAEQVTLLFVSDRTTDNKLIRNVVTVTFQTIIQSIEMNTNIKQRNLYLLGKYIDMSMAQQLSQHLFNYAKQYWIYSYDDTLLESSSDSTLQKKNEYLSFILYSVQYRYTIQEQLMAIFSNYSPIKILIMEYYVSKFDEANRIAFGEAAEAHAKKRTIHNTFEIY